VIKRKAKEKEKKEELDSSRRRDPTEEKKEEAKKGREPLKMTRRRLPKGAGVLIELPNGSPREYEATLKECQEGISLEELRIPPIAIRKARGVS